MITLKLVEYSESRMLKMWRPAYIPAFWYDLAPNYWPLLETLLHIAVEMKLIHLA